MLTIVLALLAAPGSGSCCLPDDSCTQVASEAECNTLFGVYLAGEDCVNAPCGVGACCWDSGCAETTAYQCVTAGRDFVGAGISCLDDPCNGDLGACCLTGSCVLLNEPACVDQGGIWLGPDASCEGDPCTLGACCTEEECLDLARYECDALGGTLLDGEICLTNPCFPPNVCDADALFGQNRNDPDDFEAGTSEESADLRRFDDFSGVAGAIESVTWWGLDLEFIGGDWLECTESDPTFTIAFHEDAGGFPGALVCQYELTATRTPTGLFYLGTELNEYTVDLPQPCVLVNGWISIVGLGDQNCWFLWMSHDLLNGSSWCDHCAPSEQGSDWAFCLNGTVGGVTGACCNDVTAECIENVDIASCTDAGMRFLPDGTCDELDPPCGVILGACCLPDATCDEIELADCLKIGGNWLGASTICEFCPCLVPCPEGGVPEGEPTCDDGYVDVFNGGCLAQTVAFSPVIPGATICGESGLFFNGEETAPDFDWYEVVLTEPATLSWDVQAEFRAQVWILDGTEGCDGFILSTTAGFECDELTMTTSVGPGTYWFVIAPWAFTDSGACGSRYTAKAEVIINCVGDVNNSGAVDVNDLLALLSAWGLCSPPCPYDLVPDGQVNVNDLLVMLSAWGPC